MNNRTPKPGDLYRHFKGNLYQIITVATHTETEEPLVVYLALYGDYRAYARPLLMFLEEVDRVKYPDVTQVYRFEKIERESLINTKESKEIKIALDSNNANGTDFINANATNTSNTSVSDSSNALTSEMQAEVDNEYGMVNKDLLAFLDAESYGEKLEILFAIRNKIDDRLMTDIEMSLDLSGHEGTIEDRFDLVKNNLQTLSKFESKRLR
ncbi:DUF1653 domain-containing protein [Clostridium sp. Marseille-P299]|uniref:DUF1653 domain-containing protein n=1 Tax=Clostridium sp. Marseille-P299 TaxID=1805477 RepID=UPI000835E4FD|nr:DUF1653 domain-containing protein [Clostridium sp. Marseille-P299]